MAALYRKFADDTCSSPLQGNRDPRGWRCSVRRRSQPRRLQRPRARLRLCAHPRPHPPPPPGGAEAGLSHPEAGLSGLEVGAPRNLATGGEAHHMSGHEAGEGGPPQEREGVGEEVWVVSGAGMTGRPYTLKSNLEPSTTNLEF